jgi:hypothetical protein
VYTWIQNLDNKLSIEPPLASKDPVFEKNKTKNAKGVRKLL